ncbi:pyruvoyl-dependent arginine decarboxylase [Magnetococcales bacterium HHB-1]
MIIQLSSGIGYGPTSVSAFDNALMDAGATHWNLIRLSSIIPPNSTIVETEITVPPEEFGQRRHVVMAQRFASKQNEEAWAGLGWCQDEQKKGLFVEINGHSEQSVKRDIHVTLDSMKEKRSFDLGPNQHKIIGARCHKAPVVCVLVIAVFPGVGSWPDEEQTIHPA